MSRVAISGIGVVSPYGAGRERFWTHLSRGCSATRSIADFDASAFCPTVPTPVLRPSRSSSRRWSRGATAWALAQRTAPSSLARLTRFRWVSHKRSGAQEQFSFQRTLDLLSLLFGLVSRG